MKFGRMQTEDGAKYCEIGEDYVAVINGDIFSEHHDVGPRRPLKGVELLMPIEPSKLLVVLGAFPARGRWRRHGPNRRSSPRS